MCGGSDRLGSAELGPHAPKELAEVTLRAAQRVGAHSERSSGAMLYLACFTGQHLATADSFFRAEAACFFPIPIAMQGAAIEEMEFHKIFLFDRRSSGTGLSVL